MIISKEGMAKIRKIIEKNYRGLLISLVGRDIFTEEELDELQAAGIDTSNDQSLLELIYYNNILNSPDSKTAPISISEMKKQQINRPQGEAHTVAEEHMNESFRHVVEQLRSNVQSRVEGIIRDNNMEYRGNALQNLDRPEDIDKLIKESTLGKLKQALRDYSGDADRNWQRIAITETSNALGMGSIDRIVMQNKDKSAEDVYVYRIPVNDAALCKYCRKFYLDSDESPAVYRLSTLLNNGTNYGKKTAEWKAVAVATHPNERCSGILELRPGWKVGSGGSVEFIGQDEWKKYIEEKVRTA